MPVIQPSTPVVVIKVNSSGALTTNAVTVVSGGGSGGAERLTDLIDVDSSAAAEADAVVYQANTQTFKVKHVPEVYSNAISGPIDGGNFMREDR